MSRRRESSTSTTRRAQIIPLAVSPGPLPGYPHQHNPLLSYSPARAARVAVCITASTFRNTSSPRETLMALPLNHLLPSRDHGSTRQLDHADVLYRCFQRLYHEMGRLKEAGTYWQVLVEVAWYCCQSWLLTATWVRGVLVVVMDRQAF